MKNKKIVVALVALLAAAALMVGGWFISRPDPQEGAKALTVVVVHGDKSEKEFSVRTDAEYLGDALLEHEEIGVVGEKGQYGLYIQEVDGEAASDADHTYWSLSKDGEMLMVGADSQPVADGEHYELTLTTW